MVLHGQLLVLVISGVLVLRHIPCCWYLVVRQQRTVIGLCFHTHGALLCCAAVGTTQHCTAAAVFVHGKGGRR